MLRRTTAATPRGGGEDDRGTALPLSQQQAPRRQQPHYQGTKSSHYKGGRTKITSDRVVMILVGAAALLLILAFVLPASGHPRTAAAPWEQAAEAEMKYLWQEFHHHQDAVKPPIPVHEHPQLKNHHDPDEQNQSPQAQAPPGDNNGMIRVPTRSAVTGATWVEGEQKLKRALKQLAARQAQGLDIGVPVLTRWVGDDVPAWPSAEIMPQEVWAQKVEERYAAMREEETTWRARMSEYLKQDTARG
eukprot:scaffold4676_cov164-Amphora_coffeaeformis.AAC.4